MGRVEKMEGKIGEKIDEREFGWEGEGGENLETRFICLKAHQKIISPNQGECTKEYVEGSLLDLLDKIVLRSFLAIRV